MTQKSESVREAEQRAPSDLVRELASDLVYSVAPWAGRSPEFMQSVLARWANKLQTMADAYAKSVTLKLAEEAEQEARECWENQKKHVDRYGFLSSELSNRQHDREAVAAWLREKAS